MFFDDCPIALSIDCETLSLDPRAHILQVGFYAVSLLTGRIIHPAQNRWIDPAAQKDRVIDPSTVRWWLEQDPAVRAGVWVPPPEVGYTQPEQLFDELQRILTHCDASKVRVWVRGSKDLSWLETLWGGRTPWHHRQATDMRPIVSIFDPQGELAPKDTGSKHDGAADAWYQAQHLMNVVDMLRRMEARAGTRPAISQGLSEGQAMG